MDYDKLYYTDVYNWTILSDEKGKETYIIYCKTYSDWASFVYYKYENKLKLDNILIYCPSFDKANELVFNVLKCYRWEIMPRYLGRYFKLKKIIKSI
jgi:hypothetical protein